MEGIKVLERRCPWCGEIILHDESLTFFSKEKYICMNCRGQYTRTFFNKFTLSILICISIISLIIQNSFVTLFLYIIVFISSCMLYPLSPLKKFDPLKQDVSKVVYLVKQNKEVQASIQWYSHEEGGILFPRLWIQEGFVLPICLVDSLGNPLSAPWCILITDITSLKQKQIMSFHFILDSAPSSLLKKDICFYVYNNRKVIGIGKILVD